MCFDPYCVSERTKVQQLMQVFQGKLGSTKTESIWGEADHYVETHHRQGGAALFPPREFQETAA